MFDVIAEHEVVERDCFSFLFFFFNEVIFLFVSF